MAFPIPAHLPRKNDTRDISTQVLTKISETSSKSLNAEVAATWVSELEDTIRLTKSRIHERIASDLPNFERQLATSVSVQDRLRSLSHNVDTLSESITNPQSGLISTLVKTLESHAALAREAAYARAQHGALSHLVACRDELRHLTDLVQRAELAEATKVCATLESKLADAPAPLLKSEVVGNIKRKCTTLRNRTEEQLLGAYSRSIVISASKVLVRPSVQATLPRTSVNGVPIDNAVAVDAIIGLSDILASMSPAALSMHLSTLRRDVIAHCIEHVLKQPVQIYQTTSTALTGPLEHQLSFELQPPTTEDLILRLDNFKTVMSFFEAHLFPHLPTPGRKSFPLSLCTPIKTAILNLLLLPNLPSSLDKLPGFLALAKRAVEVEEAVVVRMLGDNAADRSVKAWVDGVGLHYERKRRADILNRARVIVVSPLDESSAFRVEVPLVIEEKSAATPAVEQVHTNGTNGTNGTGVSAPVAEEAEEAWGFEEDTTPSQSEESSADGWGFDDEPVPEPEPESEIQPEPQPEPPKPAESEPPQPADEPIEDDPWGWNDDAEPAEPEDDSAWDDAWDEKPSAPAPKPEPVSQSPALKPAKGLEKRFGNKSVPSSPAFPPPHSPATPAYPQSPAPPPAPVAAATKVPPPLPTPLKPVQVTESYVVSGRTKELLRLVEDVLREGAELVASGVLAGSPGHVLVQAAPMALELFRALVPVTSAPSMKQSAKEPMRFSNDCLYVGEEVRRILGSVGSVKGGDLDAREKLEEGMARLRVLAESWFEDTIAREEKTIDELLDNARGFIDTTQQDRFDECESAVNDVLQRIRRVAPQWKAVLTKSRYYDALGSIVEAALSRILGDVLALEDITEVESHRLCELCHILNALEGLFVEDPEQPSFVVSYVPSWLKFSYLSELLEASIADISYLFDEGALVDFEIDELVKLVKALFADTPLRTNTIGRLQQGHPVRDSS